MSMDDGDFLQLVFNSLSANGESDEAIETAMRQLIESELAGSNEARREHGGEREETAAALLDRLHRQQQAQAAQRHQQSLQADGAVRRIYAGGDAEGEARQQRMQAANRALATQSQAAFRGLLDGAMATGDALGRLPSRLPILPGMGLPLR
jgi:hypothetical protein